VDLNRITDALVRDVQPLRFGPPVTCVYNPLEYARASYNLYADRFGRNPREVILLGLNPGPWGMAQTGIPFGEVSFARDWLGVEAAVGRPRVEHPKRRVEGFACSRSEVSGARVWGWAREKFGTPQRFFRRFFVANYCPLIFFEESGRNRTPDKLPSDEREPLLRVCDLALRRTVEHFQPRYVVGVGAFAESRAREALADSGLTIGRILHPSPANPQANRHWARTIASQLTKLGIELPRTRG
jgi:single-strand selective monofunctional uracil DNA glycosylase